MACMPQQMQPHYRKNILKLQPRYKSEIFTPHVVVSQCCRTGEGVD